MCHIRDNTKKQLKECLGLSFRRKKNLVSEKGFINMVRIKNFLNESRDLKIVKRTYSKPCISKIGGISGVIRDKGKVLTQKASTSKSLFSFSCSGPSLLLYMSWVAGITEDYVSLFVDLE